MRSFVITLIAIWALHGAAWAAPSHPKSYKKPYQKAQGKSYLITRAKARLTSVRLAPVAQDTGMEPALASSAAFVVDQIGGRTLYAKNITAIQPIASISKLMTAMVVLDANLDLGEYIAIADEDVDAVKHTRSRLQVHSVLSRDDLLRLALMASENRAASALSRAYPGGRVAFISAMNQKAAELGMHSTRFLDGTGLSRENVSTAEDLAKMVAAAYRYPVIQQYTTLTDYSVRANSGRVLAYHNSNGLIRNDKWHIDVSKTGYIAEAGRCLVMQARIAAKPVVIILLDSLGKQTRAGDANRLKRWVENQLANQTPS